MWTVIPNTTQNHQPWGTTSPTRRVTLETLEGAPPTSRRGALLLTKKMFYSKYYQDRESELLNM